MLIQQWQWFKKWLINRYEYKRNLIIIVGNESPNKINLYANCLLGNDLSFNSGISAIYIKEADSNVYIQDKLTGINIRVIDETTFRKYLTKHLARDIFTLNSEKVVQIISQDSTSLCGLYKTIILK